MHSIDRLPGQRPPLEQKAALPGNDVLCRTALNGSNIERGETRSEEAVPLAGKLVRQLFDRRDEACRTINCRRSLLRMRAVRLLSESRDLSQAITLSRASAMQRGRLADHGPPRPDQPGGQQVRGSDAAYLLIGRQHQAQAAS